eukprot:13255777-Ditylum_brightwellii.AAC.1
MAIQLLQHQQQQHEQPLLLMGTTAPIRSTSRYSTATFPTTTATPAMKLLDIDFWSIYSPRYFSSSSTLQKNDTNGTMKTMSFNHDETFNEDDYMGIITTNNN